MTLHETDLLAFKLMGGLSIKRNGETVGNLASRKAEALLIYLVCNRQIHSRESLATLLWDDRSLSRSLGNLSVLLTSLRKEVEPFILITRQSVSFNSESSYYLDSKVFEEKVTQARQQQAGQPLRTAAAQLTQAVQLYQGPFLAGFHIREARDFEEWMLLEQERLERLAVEGLADLVEFHLQRKQVQEGIEQAARLLALDPLREPAHRQMMHLLALDGRRNAALAQFESCRQILAEELDVEPTEETVTLYEQIRKGEWLKEVRSPATKSGQIQSLAKEPSPPVPLHNLPNETTLFVGREQELSQIALRLENPACRLLTLVGHGGIGKTRLALQAASRQIGRFVHGVWLVNLAGLSSGEGLAAAIADALELTFTGRSGLEEELLEYLQQKEMLLLLDNFEQLLENDVATDLIQTLLQQAPNVVLLVTSRERLSLRAEWLIPLEGLSYPSATAGENPAQFAAVQLFIQRAQQVEPAFTFESAPLPCVRQICQLVQGMPLAIELAATWLRLYTCDRVAARIEEDLGFLSTSLRDVPLRHRSLQTIFDHSWELLSAAEQSALARLAVFQGAFTRKAAVEITGSAETTLAALVDKSMVRQSPPDQAQNRYQIHEMLRQFASGRLAQNPTDETTTRERHCRFYVDFCEQQETRLKSGQVAEALELAGLEMDNLQSAWRWTYQGHQGPEVDRPAVEYLARMMEGFLIFFEVRGRYREALTLINEAAQVFKEQEALSSAGRVVSGRLLAWLGWYNFRLANYEEGYAQAEKGLAAILAENAWQYTGYPLLFLGAAAFGFGKLEDARSFFSQSLEVYRKLNDKWGICGNLSNLGHVATAQGDYQGAESFLLESIAISDKNNILYLNNRAVQTLGMLYSAMGEYEKAQIHLEKSLHLSDQLGDRYSKAQTLSDLGKMNSRLNNLEPAVEQLQQAREIFADIGDQLNLGWALVYLGDVAFENRQPAKAQQHWSAALQLARASKATAVILGAMKGLARLRALAGEDVIALSLLAFIQNHPEAAHQTKEETTTHFAELAASLPEELARTAETRAAGWQLADAIAVCFQ